jgi:hypothetical protein
MTFRIREVQPFVGKQIILWLEDEQSHLRGPDGDEGAQWCVRLTMDEARSLLPSMMDAYAVCMQELAMELAMGGCRTCRNGRVVDGRPCPVCVPRGERRLRSVAHLRPRPA